MLSINVINKWTLITIERSTYDSIPNLDEKIICRRISHKEEASRAYHHKCYLFHVWLLQKTTWSFVSNFTAFY